MMLYIAIKVAIGRKDKSDDLLPSNRSELYEAFISTLFSHQEKKGKHLHADRIQIENALTDFYFKLQCRNEVSCKYGEALKIVKESAEDDTFRKTTSQDILKDCCKIGLLVEKDSEIEYGIHQSFQEYFAAIKLKELFESGIDISEAFSHSRWEEVIIFTSELLDCVDEFIDLMLSKGELFLASKCVNKANGKIKKKLCTLLADKANSKYEMERRNSIESLGRIGNFGISIIVEALKDENSSVRGNAAQALGNIKSDIAVQPLINALKDEEAYVRWSVAEALGNIKSDTAVQPLVNALKDENSYVRLSAAEALGNIKSDTTVQLLINALKDKDKDVRWNAARVLGNIKSETAVKPLINALNDEDKYVRWNAVKALGNIKSDTAVQPLINALKDEYLYVRFYAAQALGNIKSEIAVQPLINALKDENSSVRWSVAGALGNIKSDTAVQPLINLLNDEDKNVRQTAAKALGNIKSETAVQPLINALKDENSSVRWSVAETLGNIKYDTEVQLLINALKDQDKNVRQTAARVLGNIKSDTVVQPLINALKDQDKDVRFYAAEALGNVKSDTAVQLLINALKDENLHARQTAARVLGNIKSDTTVQPLINALKDQDQGVQWSTASALKKICTIKNKKQLEDLLESDHEFSVNTAFEILYEIEKEERSKLISFKDLKKRSKITQKYSIFVSSVQKELENERVTIQDLVENDPFLSEYYTSLLYEYEPAYPEKTLEGCLNALNSCQIYLLIVGVKDGTLVGEISITHREYRYAKEKNLPILVFIKGERNIEREQGTEDLLKEIESDDFKYKRFKNVIELKNEVNESLKKLLRDEDKFLKI